MAEIPFHPLALTFDELVDELSRRYGRGEYHARAMFRTLYRELQPRVWASEEMAMSGHLQQRIREDTIVSPGAIVDRCEKDGVIKFITRLDDGEEIESVILPMMTHRTICVSSQVGCRMGCRFCETAKMGLRRQLRADEIVGQLFNARREFGGDIRNVVFMGMGEPFDNFSRVVQAIRVMNDQRGLDIALRYITVSTVGRIKGIRRLAALSMPQLKLAVSLNAPNDMLRSELMPVNRASPMAALQEALRDFPLKKNDDIMVAYVLIPGVNNRPVHAAELAAYLAPLRVKVNLIPFNPGPAGPYRAPTEAELSAFGELLKRARVQVQQRSTRGRELMAACGQLGAQRRPDRYAAYAAGYGDG